MRTSAQALEGALPQQPCDQVLGVCRESLVPFRPHNFICKEKGRGLGWLKGFGDLWAAGKSPESCSRGRALPEREVKA